MVDEPVNLNEVRAQEAQDCRKWTVADCLKTALRGVENGEIAPDKIVLAMSEPINPDNPEGPRRLLPYFAGVTTLEARGLMVSVLNDELNDL